MGMELCPAHSWSSLIITITVSHEGACVCVQGRFLQIVIRTLCVLGVGMIMGDGVLTPAISVVSAIEGLGNIPGGGGNIPRSQSPNQTAFSPCQCCALSASPNHLRNTPSVPAASSAVRLTIVSSQALCMRPFQTMQGPDLLCCPRTTHL